MTTSRSKFGPGRDGYSPITVEEVARQAEAATKRSPSAPGAFSPIASNTPRRDQREIKKSFEHCGRREFSLISPASMTTLCTSRRLSNCDRGKTLQGLNRLIHPARQSPGSGNQRKRLLLQALLLLSVMPSAWAIRL